MTNIDIPRLCGGVFLTYLLDARKPRNGVREHYMGETDGLSDPETFEALIKIVCPGFSMPAGKTFKENTSSYKNCKKSSGTYLPFANQADARAFDERVTTEYGKVMSCMRSFTDTYIDTDKNTKKDEYLVEALIEIIANDTTIAADELFYVQEDGSAIAKSSLIAQTSACLQSFLVGVFHYILLNRKDNKCGQNTLDSWNPTSGYIKGLRVYDCCIQTAAEDESADYATEQEEPTIDEPQTEKSENKKQGTNQTVNNPIVFNQYGNNGVQIGSIGTLIIKHDDD